MGSVTKRILTGASLAAGVGALLYLDGLAPEGLVPFSAALVLSLLSAWELGRMGSFRLLGLNPALYAAALLVAVPGWILRDELCAPGRPYLILLAGAAVVALVTQLLARRGRKLALGLGIWALVPLFGLVSVDAAWGSWGLGFLVILSKIGDIFGYFVGRAIGKSHPFPVLSPNKTTAGCVASSLAAMALGIWFGAHGQLPGEQAGWLTGAILGATINLASQAGDLLECLVKRTSGVKDSSFLAGAAGGVLDVVDSLLLSIPMALVTWPWLL